jgi:hypothetical protein
MIGNHQHFGWASQQIDADTAEQLTFGLGDVGIARPNQHINRRDRFSTQRHRCHGLHPT